MKLTPQESRVSTATPNRQLTSSEPTKPLLSAFKHLLEIYVPLSSKSIHFQSRVTQTDPPAPSPGNSRQPQLSRCRPPSDSPPTTAAMPLKLRPKDITHLKKGVRVPSPFVSAY
jgi:hypothetical protein